MRLNKILWAAAGLGLLLGASNALACEQAQDGCLGCNDEELPVCLRDLVEQMCKVVSEAYPCDRQRIYDDAERSLLISTGRHMSRLTSMRRSARKYQLR